jgi:hypothetical protein
MAGPGQWAGSQEDPAVMTADETRPALAANVRTNAKADPSREQRWRAVRDEVWSVVEPLLDPGARVAIVGAGNAHDVPLTRIAARAGHVDLVDIDAATARAAVEREPAPLRTRLRALAEDVTEGAADTILGALRDGAPPPEVLPATGSPIGAGGYDLVLGDLLYTQLLHPGLVALGLPPQRLFPLMRQYDGVLTRLLVSRLHASAPGGVVVHLHDVACWSDQHPQPHDMATVLSDPSRYFGDLVRHDGCDPHLATQDLAVPVLATHWWSWPFKPGRDFLVRATVVAPAAADGPAPAAHHDMEH